MSDKPGMISSARRLVALLEICGGGPRLLVAGLFFSTVGAFLEAATITLLVPFLELLMGTEVPRTIRFARFFELPVPPFASSRDQVLASLFVLLLGVIASKTVTEMFGAIVVGRRVAEVVTRIRQSAFERFLGFGKAYFDQTTLGHGYSTMISHSGALGNGLADMRGVLATALLSLVYVAILTSISWKLTLCGAVIYPLYYRVASALFRRIRQASVEHTGAVGQLGQAVTEALGSIALVHASGAERVEADRLRGIGRSVATLSVRLTRQHAVAVAAQELFLTALTLGLAMLGYVLLVDAGPAGASRFLVYFLVLRRLSSSLTSLLTVRLVIERTSGPVSALLALYDEADKHVVRGGTRRLDKLMKSIELRSVTFGYRPGGSVLNELSFEAHRGEVTALVGPSGAGKTTTLALLQRFYDCAPGTIFLDGVDIRDYDVASIRSRIGVVSQDVHLFNTTLRDNLCYGLAIAPSDQAVREAVTAAALDDVVAGLPSGLATVIGDRGVRLSGGEKQRVSIARAILRDVDILLLDEATSALDTEAERSIQAALAELTRGRTVLVVAHRLSTVALADKVVVLERGRVVEQGRVDELLERRGRFHHYYTLQLAG